MATPPQISIPQRLRLELEQFKLLAKQIRWELRVALPGIVRSFNATKQTVTVQLAIREAMKDETGRLIPTAIPPLPDVPIIMPRAGGWALTLPIQAGDECLVIFNDVCIDGWWERSGLQNEMELRRHDLGDPMAIFGPWSQPKKLSSYSTSAAELRNEAGTVKISLTSSEIDINAPTVKINGKNFATHQHTDPQGGVTGGVV